MCTARALAASLPAGQPCCALTSCPTPLPPPTPQGYYVNLLKTISLKLNENTVQFFFQAATPRSPGGGGGGTPRAASFPLYTESIKFINHRRVLWGGGRLLLLLWELLWCWSSGLQAGRLLHDSTPARASTRLPFRASSPARRDPMVRTAVKTLTLNVYAIRLPAVQAFVACRPAASYFAELATYIGEQCQARAGAGA